MVDDNDEQEYSDVETVALVTEALSKRSTLPITFLETRLYEGLYEALLPYMNRVDILFMLSELRTTLLSGFSYPSAAGLHSICRKCKACVKTKGSAIDPGWNMTDPDLMIIVENPDVFAFNQDFLVKALKTVGFRSDRCMITYATRCPMNTADVDSIALANCVPYLHTEIAAINPKLILPLGSKVYGTVTGDVINKISDVEGTISWFGLYPVLPGMSLAWYSKTAERSDTRGNGRFVDLLTAAHNFLYSASQETK